MSLKRSRGEDREVEALAMANCLKLLSRMDRSVNLDGRVYECKICNKKFPSSQALGGHCARHKMPRVKESLAAQGGIKKLEPAKIKVHECPICGLEFAVGQALGGHMRRHRADIKEELDVKKIKLSSNTTSLSVPVLKRSNNRRIFCLDLNLTPYENDLKMGYQMSPEILNTMSLKRSRGEDREVEALAMANCLKLLSRMDRSVNLDGRVYECKICNKKFPSSQALGGHCARHKMPRVKESLAAQGGIKKLEPAKIKVHECPICGLEFAVGQALGGHMRRHRADIKEELDVKKIKTSSNTTLSVPVLKRSNSRRIFCLDLNLTPYENDLKMGYQMSPVLT